MSCTALDIIGTAITLLAVIVALFGEKIRSSWFAPKLEVSLYDPKGEVNTITNGPKCRYYHLKATNSTNRNMAHNVTINIVKIEDIGSDGCVRLVCQGDVPFRWMYQELYPDWGCYVLSLQKEAALAILLCNDLHGYRRFGCCISRN